MSQRHSPAFSAANIVTIDQENHAIHAVVNGAATVVFDPAADLDTLPAGGGYVVADGNTWSVRNERSQSQYCWDTETDLAEFITALGSRGYRAVTVANKLANTLCTTYQVAQADAVRALYFYVHDQVSQPTGRAEPDQLGTASGPLVCGCTSHSSFDSGHSVRLGPPRGDASFGARAQVTSSFLVLQNTGGYDSPFADAVVAVAWDALDGRGRALFNMLAKSPVCHVANRNRLMAVAVCTHDPATGALRMHGGRRWGLAFITGRVIGLNGTMRGTGDRAPGNPMRAVLRVLGRRSGAKVNRAERAELDRHVGVLIRALGTHPVLGAQGRALRVQLVAADHARG